MPLLYSSINANFQIHSQSKCCIRDSFKTRKELSFSFVYMYEAEGILTIQHSLPWAEELQASKYDWNNMNFLWGAKYYSSLFTTKKKTGVTCLRTKSSSYVNLQTSALNFRALEPLTLDDVTFDICTFFMFVLYLWHWNKITDKCSFCSSGGGEGRVELC